jgi:hypothetical protein
MIREKEKLKAEYKKDLQKTIIDKAEFKSKAIENDLHDIHGDYLDKKLAYSGTLGGQLMQIYFVLDTIKGFYEGGLDEYKARMKENEKDDYLLKPNNPAEILVPSHLRHFLHQYLKDMKNDYMHIVLHNDVALWLENNLVAHTDLHKMTPEQKAELKKLFVSKKGHYAFQEAD